MAHVGLDDEGVRDAPRRTIAFEHIAVGLPTAPGAAPLIHSMQDGAPVALVEASVDRPSGSAAFARSEPRLAVASFANDERVIERNARARFRMKREVCADCAQ